LVHLLTEARDIQLKRWEDGHDEPSDEQLFDPISLKEALPFVSRARYELTLCAENPYLQDMLKWLMGKKPKLTLENLADAWGISIENALAQAEKIVDAGVFERQGTKGEPIFNVVPLYRDALEMGRGQRKLRKYISTIPTSILNRLSSKIAVKRAAAVEELASLGDEDSFSEISSAFDDPSVEVRNAAARALFNLNTDRAATFTRVLREAPLERRRKIGAAMASSGLAGEAIGQLMGESREKTYDAFSFLFLMSKAGEVQLLVQAIEEHQNDEVRMAVIKLLALSGQQDILPVFRRLAVRGSIPTEVRSYLMASIYEISSKIPTSTTKTPVTNKEGK
jgi:hypothetical protein